MRGKRRERVVGEEPAQRGARHGRVDERSGVAALDRLESFRIEAARRRGIEHGAAADRRVRAQHDAVATSRDDGAREA